MQNSKTAKELMITKLITLSPEMNVFDAIKVMLKNKISGAPVIDSNQTYLGVFSEKCCMSVLVDAAYAGTPSTRVDAYMNKEARTITEETDLLNIAQIFLNTNSRRLPVLRDGKLLGQISRRDILKAIHDLSEQAKNQDSALLYLSSLVERNEAPIA